MSLNNLKRKKDLNNDYEKICQDIETIIQKETTEIVLRGCSKACLENEVECEFKNCEHWISFEEDNNCDLISIQKHGQMTLRQIGERMGVSYVRIKQIEDAALKKIKNNISIEQIEN